MLHWHWGEVFFTLLCSIINLIAHIRTREAMGNISYTIRAHYLPQLVELKKKSSWKCSFKCLTVTSASVDKSKKGVSEEWGMNICVSSSRNSQHVANHWNHGEAAYFTWWHRKPQHNTHTSHFPEKRGKATQSQAKVVQLWELMVESHSLGKPSLIWKRFHFTLQVSMATRPTHSYCEIGNQSKMILYPWHDEGG